MTFHDAYHYSDVTIARKFEGIKTNYNYSDSELQLVTLTQFVGLTQPITPMARKRMISRLYFEPFKDILALWKNPDYVSVPSYRLYSAHDT